MDSSRQQADRLSTRLAFMNAENDRLKKVILDYERRMADSLTSRRSLQSLHDLEDCSDDSQLAAIGFQRMQPKDAEKRGKAKIGARSTVEELKRQLDRVSEDNQRLSQENCQYKKQLRLGNNKENKNPGAYEPSSKEYIQAIKHLKSEVENLQALTRELRDENKRLFTEEELFEKLREQEVMLLGTLKLSEKSDRDESFNRRRLDGNSLGFSAGKSDNYPASHNEDYMSSGKVPLTWRQHIQTSEDDSRYQMHRLERKVDELILENESILKENQDLKDLSLSILNSTRRSTSNCTCGSQQQGGSPKHSKPSQAIQEETFSSRDREIVDFVQLLETRFNKEKQSLEERVQELESQVNGLKKVRSQAPSPIKGVEIKTTNGQELDEAYNIIERLEKENRLLLKRIDHLEHADSINKEETDKLYTIIEQKNKTQSEWVRERSLELARQSYGSRDSPS